MTMFEYVPVARTSLLGAHGACGVRVWAQVQPIHAWFLRRGDPGSLVGRATFTVVP